MKRVCKHCGVDETLAMSLEVAQVAIAPIVGGPARILHCVKRDFAPHEYEDVVEEDAVARLARIREYVERLFASPLVGRGHFGMSVDDAKFLLDQLDFHRAEHEAFATQMAAIKMAVEKVLPTP